MIYLKKACLYHDIAEELFKIPEIIECHYVTGNYSLFIKQKEAIFNVCVFSNIIPTININFNMTLTTISISAQSKLHTFMIPF